MLGKAINFVHEPIGVHLLMPKPLRDSWLIFKTKQKVTNELNLILRCVLDLKEKLNSIWRANYYFQIDNSVWRLN